MSKSERERIREDFATVFTHIRMTAAKRELVKKADDAAGRIAAYVDRIQKAVDGE